MTDINDITRAQIDAADAYFRRKGGQHLPGGFFWCELLAEVFDATPPALSSPAPAAPKAELVEDAAYRYITSLDDPYRDPDAASPAPAVALLDIRPNIGAIDAEPSLRRLVQFYYAARIDDHNLVNRYTADYLAAIESAAPTAMQEEALTTCVTCQGFGSRAHPDDPCPIPCPDCFGTGAVSATPPAGEGREALDLTDIVLATVAVGVREINGTFIIKADCGTKGNVVSEGRTLAETVTALRAALAARKEPAR